jgi:ribosomal protein L11 methyltransferase
MRRAVLRVQAAAVEDVLDALLPHLRDGVHERPLGDGSVELAADSLTGALPPLDELAAAAGPALLEITETEVPSGWRERRLLAGGGFGVGGRIWLRTPLDPPGPGCEIELVIDRASTFGAGTHPTTRMCLDLMLGLPVRGSFADLGCGAGTLAIAAARLGFEPVLAVDASTAAVAATTANASRNGVAVRAEVVDLEHEPSPVASVAAANVPLHVHAALAARFTGELRTLIASGVELDGDALVATYARAGLRPAADRCEGGWVAVRLERP